MSEIFNRLQKNYRKISAWAQKNKVESFRIYDRDIPAYPYMIDVYGDTIVIQDRREPIDFEDKKKKNYEEMVSAVKEITNPKELIIKERRVQRVGGEKSDQYQKLSNKDHRKIVTESQAQFYVNLHDYLDTGLFLDHRRVRQLIYSKSQPGYQFLNLFSYTGTGSVFAALKGAKTTSVDLSNTYTEWAKDNFKANNLNLSEHEFITEDAREYLKNSKDLFDLIFLDPPTFSNSKKTEDDFEIERDQLALLNLTMARLKPGGQLIFSTNKRSFKLSPEVRAKWQVKDVSKDTLPIDFHDSKIRQVYLLSLK